MDEAPILFYAGIKQVAAYLKLEEPMHCIVSLELE